MVRLSIAERNILYPLLTLNEIKDSAGLMEALNDVSTDDQLMKKDLEHLKQTLSDGFGDDDVSKLLEDARDGTLLSPLPYFL